MKIYLIFSISFLLVTNIYPQNSFDCKLPDGGEQSLGGDDNNWGFIIYGIGSWDPNLIVTPTGVGKPRFVSVNDKMGITIYFENDPKLATAPVHNAYIYYKFNPKQDPISFQLSSFGFNDTIFTIPAGKNTHQQRLDLRTKLGLYVDITAGINVTNNTAFWIFQSIDPLTNLPPADPLKGFLPIKDTSAAALKDSTGIGSGEGFVSFTAEPYKTAQTRDTIYAQAQIVFDVNDTIPTNIEFNTIDAVAPTSKIYMSTVADNTISLFWEGTDDAGGSGVKDYSVYVSENNGPFTFYKTVSGPTTEYTGNPGGIYCFYVMARDSVNNMESPLKNTCEVTDTLADDPLPVTWLYFRGQEQGNNVLLSWATGSEINTNYFNVERSLNGRDFEDVGKVNASRNSNGSTYTYIDVNAMKLSSNNIYYRLRQVDLDGKFAYSNVLTFTTKKEQFVKVYPNPFSQALTLEINTAETAVGSDHLELYSINGMLLYKRTLADRMNNMPIVLNDLPVLARGTYIIRTYLNGNVNTVKVIKQ